MAVEYVQVIIKLQVLQELMLICKNLNFLELFVHWSNLFYFSDYQLLQSNFVGSTIEMFKYRLDVLIFKNWIAYFYYIYLSRFLFKGN